MLNLVLVLAFGLALFTAGWWASAPMHWLWRWMFRLAVLTMIAGLSLPPAAIGWVRDRLSLLVPLAREVSESPGTSYLVHFFLFLVVSALLFWFRQDLGRRRMLAAMVVLAFLMEGVQLLVDGRFASWWDVLANLTGVAVAAAVWVGKAATGR
ncbi:MAG: VanZ family protein [Wenzhouxiangella sp.]|nr:VanZ family protein [Wenzhouxiangella sp.]